MVRTLLLYDGKMGSSEMVSSRLSYLIGNAKVADLSEAPGDLTPYGGLCIVFTYYGAVTAMRAKAFLKQHSEELIDRRVVLVGIGLKDMSFNKMVTNLEWETGIPKIIPIFIASVTEETNRVGMELSRIMRAPKKPMEPDQLKNLIDRFLAEHNTMALATGSSEGVRCTPLEYMYMNGAFYITTEGGMKYRGILENGRVSGAIFDSYTTMVSVRGLQFSGKAYDVPMDSMEYYDILAQKAVSEKDAKAMPVRVFVIRIEPNRFELLDRSLLGKGYDSNQVYDVMSQPEQNRSEQPASTEEAYDEDASSESGSEEYYEEEAAVVEADHGEDGSEESPSEEVYIEPEEAEFEQPQYDEPGLQEITWTDGQDEELPDEVLSEDDAEVVTSEEGPVGEESGNDPGLRGETIEFLSKEKLTEEIMRQAAMSLAEDVMEVRNGTVMRTAPQSAPAETLEQPAQSVQVKTTAETAEQPAQRAQVETPAETVEQPVQSTQVKIPAETAEEPIERVQVKTPAGAAEQPVRKAPQRTVEKVQLKPAETPEKTPSVTAGKAAGTSGFRMPEFRTAFASENSEAGSVFNTENASLPKIDMSVLEGLGLTEEKPETGRHRFDYEPGEVPKKKKEKNVSPAKTSGSGFFEDDEERSKKPKAEVTEKIRRESDADLDAEEEDSYSFDRLSKKRPESKNGGKLSTKTKKKQEPKRDVDSVPDEDGYDVENDLPEEETGKELKASKKQSADGFLGRVRKAVGKMLLIAPEGSEEEGEEDDGVDEILKEDVPEESNERTERAPVEKEREEKKGPRRLAPAKKNASKKPEPVDDLEDESADDRDDDVDDVAAVDFRRKSSKRREPVEDEPEDDASYEQDYGEYYEPEAKQESTDDDDVDMSDVYEDLKDLYDWGPEETEQSGSTYDYDDYDDADEPDDGYSRMENDRRSRYRDEDLSYDRFDEDDREDDFDEEETSRRTVKKPVKKKTSAKKPGFSLFGGGRTKSGNKPSSKTSLKSAKSSSKKNSKQDLGRTRTERNLSYDDLDYDDYDDYDDRSYDDLDYNGYDDRRVSSRSYDDYDEGYGDDLDDDSYEEDWEPAYRKSGRASRYDDEEDVRTSSSGRGNRRRR